jgi:hypothetical protein
MRWQLAQRTSHLAISSSIVDQAKITLSIPLLIATRTNLFHRGSPNNPPYWQNEQRRTRSTDLNTHGIQKSGKSVLMVYMMRALGVIHEILAARSLNIKKPPDNDYPEAHAAGVTRVERATAHFGDECSTS